MGNLAASLAEIKSTKPSEPIKLREVQQTQSQHFSTVGIVERVVKVHFHSHDVRIASEHLHDDLPAMCDSFGTTRNSNPNLQRGKIVD